MEQIRGESKFQRQSWPLDSELGAFVSAPAGKRSQTSVGGCAWVLLSIWATRQPSGFSAWHFSFAEKGKRPQPGRERQNKKCWSQREKPSLLHPLRPRLLAPPGRLYLNELASFGHVKALRGFANANVACSSHFWACARQSFGCWGRRDPHSIPPVPEDTGSLAFSKSPAWIWTLSLLSTKRTTASYLSGVRSCCSAR